MLRPRCEASLIAARNCTGAIVVKRDPVNGWNCAAATSASSAPKLRAAGEARREEREDAMSVSVPASTSGRADEFPPLDDGGGVPDRPDGRDERERRRDLQSAEDEPRPGGGRDATLRPADLQHDVHGHQRAEHGPEEDVG